MNFLSIPLLIIIFIVFLIIFFTNGVLLTVVNHRQKKCNCPNEFTPKLNKWINIFKGTSYALFVLCFIMTAILIFFVI